MSSLCIEIPEYSNVDVNIKIHRFLEGRRCPHSLEIITSLRDILPRIPTFRPTTIRITKFVPRQFVSNMIGQFFKRIMLILYN